MASLAISFTRQVIAAPCFIATINDENKENKGYNLSGMFAVKFQSETQFMLMTKFKFVK